jgi:hypothetical protein
MRSKTQLRHQWVLTCLVLYDFGQRDHHGITVSSFSTTQFLAPRSCRSHSQVRNSSSKLHQSTLEKEDQAKTLSEDGNQPNTNNKKTPKGMKMSTSEGSTDNKTPTLSDRIANSGMASAASLATAAVNAAVAMRTLEAPDVSKSYVAMDDTRAGKKSQIELDKDGLPLVYDKDAIERYWRKERGALNQRWGYFVGKAVPFFTKMVALFIKDGKIDEKYIPELSEQARMDLQDLGPTFIKVGWLGPCFENAVSLPQILIHKLVIFPA